MRKISVKCMVSLVLLARVSTVAYAGGQSGGGQSGGQPGASASKAYQRDPNLNPPGTFPINPD
jgi:hypothetical protein